jgi:hypothetical protein
MAVAESEDQGEVEMKARQKSPHASDIEYSNRKKRNHQNAEHLVIDQAQ